MSNICKKSFSRIDYLRCHQLIHYREELSMDSTYTCEIYQKHFIRIDNFLQHKKSHSEESTLFKCNICDALFTWGVNLKCHEYPQYSCSESSDTFSRKDNLMHHTRVSHSSMSTIIAVKKAQTKFKTFEILFFKVDS